MASNTIRPRAWIDGDIATLKMLITHPMETGRRKDKKSGKVIPAHFIETLKVEHNGQVVLDALLGPAVSKNPFIQCKFKGAKSKDALKISWIDNKGETDSKDAKIN
ncbi:MAG: thiosulfate oxidation carrier complex protein SoxZ [Gammaproteobacteria bacterium]|nr:thiosulfate oxidation carrier complex protein SoxZ [Gammaproteobacteria bacterium]